MEANRTAISSQGGSLSWKLYKPLQEGSLPLYYSIYSNFPTPHLLFIPAYSECLLMCLHSSLRPLCESLYGVAATNWMEATCFTWCFMSVSLQHRIWAPHIVCYILCKTTLISIHCWTVAFAVGFGNVSRWWCIPYRFTCTPGFLLEKDGAGPHILEDFNVWDKWKKF